MKKRITITLDEKLIWMLRNKQIQMMLDGNKPSSISAVVRDALHKFINVETMINKEQNSLFVASNSNLFGGGG